MAKNTTNKQTYIQSIEGALIYEATHRGSNINTNRSGSIPFSLELIELRNNGMDEFKVDKWNEELNKYDTLSISDMVARDVKKISKFNTDDIINVSFKTKVKNRKDTIKSIKQGMEKTIVSMQRKEKTEEEINEFINKQESKIKDIESSNNKNWDLELSSNAVRAELYATGFTLTNHKGEKVDYVDYKRSSSKARTGNVLFIRKELAQHMQLWSRMGLAIEEGKEIDNASLRAYEALVSSSIKDTVKIDPKNILIVTDVASTFKTPVKEILSVNGELESRFNEEGIISNELFDGQGLLDSSYFNGKGMMLLRQHFFKSCVFNANVIQFMKDNFKDDYDTATIKDMFGNKIKVKDIHMITTPSSLKVFKFSNLVGTDKQMYSHWKKVVKADKSLFGICKSESVTKRGTGLQQMSYQMINSLPATKEQILKLAQFEIDYIERMKNDIHAFIEHLELTATINNNNAMLVDLYKRNSDVMNTEFFKRSRSKIIHKYGAKVKTGKIRVEGDYAVMVGNPYEMLLHSIGKLDTNNLASHTIKGVELHTTLFKDGTELVGFRNPHTSANNIYACVNKIDSMIERYFNFTPNIVAVNVIENPILDFLSGADFDSDNVLLTNNETLVEISKTNEAIVCINKIDSSKNSYTLNSNDRATVDNFIHSDLIGKVVNTGQLCQSIMYDAIAKGDSKTVKQSTNLLEIINVFSTIAIDLAKKKFDIDIEGEYKRLNKMVKEMMKVDADGKELFPNFLGKDNSTHYNTPMDNLIKVFKISRADEIKDTVEMFDLVMPCDENGEKYDIQAANDKQERELIEIVERYTALTRSYRSKAQQSNTEEEAKFYNNEIVNESDRLHALVSKRSIKPVTMYAILYHAFYAKSIDNDIVSKLMGVLHGTKTKTFINAFCAK